MSGSFFVGRCTCGYESPLVHQSNTSDRIESAFSEVPVVCLQCDAVFPGNGLVPEQIVCPSCHSPDVLPMARAVEHDLKGWATHLISGPFPCPSCHRWSMEIDVGQWD